MKIDRLTQFSKTLRYSFKNTAMLEQVFVHRSYLNEHPSFKLPHNERLEFLGDAVLELIVTEHLYRTLPNPEGELTNLRAALVKGETLYKIADHLGMEQCLQLSKGEQGGERRARNQILANAFEALIGAIYLDGGLTPTRELIERTVLQLLPKIMENNLHKDPKSTLQEKMQEEHGVTPTYKVLKETGPDHDRTFIVGVLLNKKLLAEGSGRSKQEAQQAAAVQALQVKGF